MPSTKPAASKSRAPARKPRARPAPAEPQATKLATFAELARQRPVLVIGGGLLAGVVAAALLPRGTAGRIARGAVAAAAVGSELGLSLARQARDTAGEASGHLRESAGKASVTARRLGHGTVEAAGHARSSALDLARTALNLLASLKR